MVLLRSCCLCFTPRTGSVVLGCLGILVFVLLMVPHVLILQDHEFYIAEFIKAQRTLGTRDILPEEIPAISWFSRVVWSLWVAYDVIFTFASIFLISGVAAEKRFLLIPWLVLVFSTILFCVVMVLAAMLAQTVNMALCILLISAPFFGLTGYFWTNVYSTFHQMRKDTAGNHACSASNTASNLTRACSSSHTATALELEDGDATPTPAITQPFLKPGSSDDVLVISAEQPSCTTVTTASIVDDPDVVTQSASVTSLASRKSQQQQGRVGILANAGTSGAAAAATPPPPYEAVAIDITKEAQALAEGVCGSQELVYFEGGRAVVARRRSKESASTPSSHSSLASEELIQLADEAAPASGHNSSHNSSRKGSASEQQALIRFEEAAATSTSTAGAAASTTRPCGDAESTLMAKLDLSPDSIQSLGEMASDEVAAKVASEVKVNTEVKATVISGSSIPEQEKKNV